MRFRKLPIEIEAEQFWPGSTPFPEGVEQYTAKAKEGVGGDRNSWYAWRVDTLEGPLSVKPGDWIITGIEGEHYPCKPDIFEQTYERVDD